MIKKRTLIFGIIVLMIPSFGWAGFFSRDPVSKALDDYETNRDVARQQMTMPVEQGGENVRQESTQPVMSSRGTQKEHKTFETEAGFESYAYQYRETVGGERFMRMKGVFYGIYLKNTFRPNQLDPFYSDMMDFFQVEVRYAWARLNYLGGVQDPFGDKIADLTMSRIPDIVFETRLLVGKDLSWRGVKFTPYSGLGFRFLRDDSSDTIGTFTYLGTEYSLNGYLRKSYYYYLPIGIDISKTLAQSWQIGWNAEFDYLVYGTQKSYTAALNNSVPTNRQTQGYGLRTSLRLEKTTPAIGFLVEPFFRFWDIENSEWAETGCIPDVGCFGVVEPSNTTREIGVKMGLTF
jgi:hypothetical protein